MIASNPDAIRPGAAIGMTILVMVLQVLLPSSHAPSNTSFGKSMKYERAIQMIRGRFIDVYTMIKVNRLSNRFRRETITYSGTRIAANGIKRVESTKKSMSFEDFLRI